MQTKSVGSNLILFFLNPFLSAIVSLKNIRDGVSHRILYLWFLVFGIGFCAMNEAADSFRYVEEFMMESQYTWGRYLLEVQEWATFESNIKDIYTLTVNVLVGKFTSNYHWTYLIYAAVFGFFYIKSLKIFLKHQMVKKEIVFYALLFMFCYSNPIFNINGVRFWTAAWIGVYVALNLFVERKYRMIPLLILMPLVHGSSVIWVVIMLAAIILSRFQKVTIGLYLASSFVSAVSYLNILNDYSYMLPQFMQNQIWSYTESEMALERLAGISEYGAAYADFLIALPGYFQILLSILLILNRKEINQNKEAGILMTVTLALAAITNFLSGIPSMGRFQAFVIPFLVIVWSMNHDILKKYDRYFYAVPILYAYSLLYWYRHMSSVTELYLYIFPAPLTAINYLFL
ncbi:EpsG family protein [bacterium]|nr:EpsG family protein [bacterium]